MATENPSPSAPKTETYKPRDPMFFALACGMLAAALHPDTLAESDADAADKIGEMCARALDRGIVPANFLMPKTRRVLDLVHRRDILQGAETDRPLAGQSRAPIMTEGEKQKERELLSRAGPIPSREEVMLANQKEIEALADLSEPVRMSALVQAALRLDAKPQITGARADEALAIVVEEIARAVRFHKAAGNPTIDLLEGPNAANVEDPARCVPYPGSMVVELLRAGAAAAAAGVEEELHAGEGVAAPPAPAAPAPAQGTLTGP